MDGLGSYSNGIFGGGAFGGDGFGADDGTTTPALPAAGGEAKSFPLPDSFLGSKTIPAGLAPDVDAAFFVRDPSGAAHLKPEVLAAIQGALAMYSAGGLSAAAYPPGIAAPLSASVIVPTAQVAGNPYFEPLTTVIAKAQAFGYGVLLPKQIVIPAASPATWLAISGPAVNIAQFGAAASGNLFVIDPAPKAGEIKPVVKKAGMSLSTTVLIGVGVLAAGYVGTRVMQKKPIFPKGK